MRTAALIAALSVLVTAGCAQQPVGPPPTITPPARCSSQPQCDAMWSEAAVQLQNLSGMKIQVATASLMQTYNPTGFNRLAASARRTPQPDGTTAIEAQFSCPYKCGNLPYEAVNLFTASMNAVGARFTTTPAQAAPAPMDKESYKQMQLQKLTEENLPYDQYQQRYKAIMAQ